MGFVLLPVLLIGLIEWLALFVGQGLVLMLSESTRLRTRVLRSIAYWAAVAGVLALASTVPALRQAVLLPMLFIAAIPYHAVQWLVEPLGG